MDSLVKKAKYLLCEAQQITRRASANDLTAQEGVQMKNSQRQELHSTAIRLDRNLQALLILLEDTCALYEGTPAIISHDLKTQKALLNAEK